MRAAALGQHEQKLRNAHATPRLTLAIQAMDLLGDRDSDGQAVRTSGLITHPG